MTNIHIITNELEYGLRNLAEKLSDDEVQYSFLSGTTKTVNETLGHFEYEGKISCTNLSEYQVDYTTHPEGENGNYMVEGDKTFTSANDAISHLEGIING